MKKLLALLLLFAFLFSFAHAEEDGFVPDYFRSLTQGVPFDQYYDFIAERAAELIAWGQTASLSAEEVSGQVHACMSLYSDRERSSLIWSLHDIHKACSENGQPSEVLDALFASAGLCTAARTYRDVLDAYYRAVEQHWDRESMSCAGICENVFDVKDGLHNIGYTCLDLDQDGSWELIIIGHLDLFTGYPQYYLFDLYTMDQELGRPVKLIWAFTRNRFHFLADWTLYNEGSDGAPRSHFIHYKVNGLQIEVIDGVNYDAEYDVDHPWFLTHDDDWDTSNDTHITEAEGKALIKGWQSSIVSPGLYPLADQNW